MLLPLLFVASTASAGEIALTKSTSMGVHVFVDGAYSGKLTKKTPITVSVADGKHEIWVAYDDKAVDTACYGTIEVKGTFAWDVRPVNHGCPALTPEFGEKTASKGGFASFTTGGQKEITSFQIDGSTEYNGDALLNLAPGTHAVVVTAGVTTSERQICMGSLTIEPGATRNVTVAANQCVGFDNEFRIIY